MSAATLAEGAADRAVLPSATAVSHVRLIDDDSGAAWDRFATSHADARFYHQYRWRALTRAVFDRETFYLAAETAAGEVTGILPLVRLKSLLFGDFLVSLPYVNYGGVVARTDAIAGQLITRAGELARELGVAHLELRHTANHCADWPVRTEKVAMVLPLPRTPDELMKSLDSKVRAQIRRPQREGAQCVAGGVELLDEFYQVFALKMRELGTPVYSKALFRAVLEQFPQQSRLLVVRMNGAAAAAGMLLEHAGCMEIPWAASLRAADRLGVNMFLYWNALTRAIESGLGSFDFGRCTLDSGTYRFKRQWGAQPLQFYWHYWLRGGGELPRLNHSNPKYEAMIAAWRRLPLPVANWLGPRLVRNLP